MKKLKLIASSLLVMSVLTLNSVGVNAKWKQDSNGWWNTEGNSWTVGWKEIDGKWYYFNSDGYMEHDTTIDGYKIGSDGAWIQSTQNVSADSEKDEKTAENYLADQGYKIITSRGKTSEYILEKNMLWGSSGDYSEVWGVQRVEPDKYFGKQIIGYNFIVKNHPLEKIYNVNTNVYVLISDGQIIGGTSFPDGDFVGGCYSLDGKTLEEITGLSYEQWCDNWKKKYAS
ncbi:cell wall binding repeat-containing protein [Clostridium sp. DL-VIII]|uniref:cell wall-binding repeat-containing protein n=1 Tax=Clostridium sp. DL-VIII TaxID=641107 RepID=UPI00023AFC3E|nr:cell wall-binding repeat-containing protein [Clostridium sp. DL-VIII]EHI99512.1 cell wall binding repeat-containing protein [Clostridium sp. DL-VIII]